MKDAGAEPLTRLAETLKAEGYRGEIAADRATRVVLATDNSVYELMPRAVLFPREPDDLNRIMRAARLSGLAITARGGGTGTNGQSLTDSVVVDCSRHLTAIERLDPDSGIAVVQPGVILADLNRAAAPHGLHFGPTVSTASRATLGGMAATDASGKGSRVFGRTSDHILSMDVVLSDGTDWHAAPLNAAQLETVCARDDLAGHIHRTLREVVTVERNEIARVFPVMNRGLTGYNLKGLWPENGCFALSRLLAGSEGTLALTKRLTLRLLRMKPLKALMVAAYDDALAALGDAERLTSADPVAVEFIDDRIVDLAREDTVWTDIAAVLDQRTSRPIRGLNFVEVQADSEAELAVALSRLDALQSTAPAALVSTTTLRDSTVSAQIWALRAKCVGLLGRMDPARHGTPFVEDAAVPPQNLRAFVEGFRAILDGHGLAYGMFGHADVGCVHVRPALDMRRPEDAAMIRKVSDAVTNLAQAHGGILWGAHGKGLRGEYGPQVFGARLYAALCRIKAAFDPGNILNPGKIAGLSPDQRLHAIDTVPFRGRLDAGIAAERLGDFGLSVTCNGNGQCFNRDLDDAMCPSYKATGDRRYSPKGRAALIRDWLRLEAGARAGEAEARAHLPGAETALHDALATCLSCKACASRCPVKVDIPTMRSRFLAQYHERHRRPLRHHLIAALEPLGPLLRTAPAVGRMILRLARPVMALAGLEDLPDLRTARRKAPPTVQSNRPIVMLVEDSFLGTFDGGVIEAAETLLAGFGYTVLRSGVIPNGKALHVLGMRDRFHKTARLRHDRLSALAKRADVLVGIEPVVSAMDRGDYNEADVPVPALVPLDRFLHDELAVGRIGTRPLPATEEFTLLSHCSEAASDPASATRWQGIFAAFDLTLTPRPTGCCGMAGMFGHEAEHRAISRRLYDMTWRGPIEATGGSALATGFSCRCQAKRFSGVRPDHPVEVLARLGARA